MGATMPKQKFDTSFNFGANVASGTGGSGKKSKGKTAKGGGGKKSGAWKKYTGGK